MSEVRRWRSGQPLGVWWLLPVGLAVALWLLLGDNLRSYGYALTATLVVAALVRLVTPKDRAGGLVVRSRGWDVAILLTLAVATTLLTANLVLG